MDDDQGYPSIWPNSAHANKNVVLRLEHVGTYGSTKQSRHLHDIFPQHQKSTTNELKKCAIQFLISESAVLVSESAVLVLASKL